MNEYLTGASLSVCLVRCVYGIDKSWKSFRQGLQLTLLPVYFAVHHALSDKKKALL